MATQNQTSDLGLKTFDQWSKEGFKIIKGSKATWEDGIPKFSSLQVIKKERDIYWALRCHSDYDDYEILFILF